MSIARVTSKGRITIPIEVRQALGIEGSDGLRFELIGEGGASVQVVKRRRLSELYGALPATRPFPGKKAVREEVGHALGSRSRRTTKGS
jgi:AbrB family looped-hinge helix DNA binding protein